MKLPHRLFALLFAVLSIALVPTQSTAQTPQKPVAEVQALLDKGQGLEKAKKLDEAAAAYTEALKRAQALMDRKGESTALFNLGYVSANKDDHPGAIKLYEKALAIAQAGGDKQQEADVTKSMGNSRYFMGEPMAAVELWRKALPIYKELGNRINVAGMSMNMGVVLENTGQPAKALVLYEEALPVFRELKNKGAEANVLANMGKAHTKLGNEDKGFEFNQQALALYREVKDKRSEANMLQGIAGHYLTIGEVTKALTIYNEGLTLSREANDKRVESIALQNIGTIYSDTGQSARALENFHQALAIKEAVGDKRGQIVTLDSIGIVLVRTGEPKKGMEYFERSLALARALSDPNQEASILNNIAYGYLEISQRDEALQYFLKARERYQKLGDKSGEAAVQNGIASIQRYKKQYRESLENYQKSLAYHETVGDKHGSASIYGNIANVYIDLKNYPEAERNSKKSLELFELTSDSHGISTAYQGLGLQAQKTGKHVLAKEYFGKSLKYARDAGNLGYQISVLHALSESEIALKQPQQAEEHLAQAVGIVEGIRTNLGGYANSKSTFLGSKLSVYYDYLRVLLSRNKLPEAFAVAQKTKSRSLLDLLAYGRIDMNASLSAEEKTEGEALQGEAEALNAAMVKQGVENEVGSKKRYEALKAKLKDVEGKINTFTDRLYARHPGLAERRVAHTTTLAELCKVLPADTAVLDYVVAGKNDVRLFVVTRFAGKPSLSVYQVSKNYSALNAQSERFHTICSNPRKSYLAEARALYRSLLKPAEAQFRGIKRLVICPDGALWDVPFQALTASGPTSFLGAKYEIAYAYSSTGVQSAIALSTKHKVAPGHSILVAANPSFGSADRFGDLKEISGQRPIESAARPIDAPARAFESASRPIDLPSRAFEAAARTFESASRAIESASRGKAIRSLPGTQREANALKKLFPDATVLTGEDAQETSFKQKAADFRYLHLATHGFVNDGSPLLSSVIMAKPDGKSSEDGFLTAREIYGLNLNAEMTVLSACNTARGENRTGEGVIGLTWALFVAGCPTQVVSQWAVDDKSTALLMGRFYENLKVRNIAKAASLKEAETWLRKQNAKYSHPYYWAPFVLNGAWK